MPVDGATPGGAAHGHAQLLSREPPDGAILAEPPEAVRLRFNEPVAIGRLVLVVADGAVLDLAGRSEGDTAQASLPTTLRTETHVVSYRVVSADGHPVGGSIGFSIGAPTTRPRGDAVSWALPPVAIVTLRTVLLALLAVAVGGAAFLAILPAGVAGGAARRPVLIAASAVPPVVLVALALQPDLATIEPVERPARRGPDGLWRIAELPVPLAGRWSVRLDVLVGDFEKTVLEGVVELRR